MLAVQLVACHAAAVRALRLLKESQTIPQPDTNGNLAVKLMRTFTTQVEALQRYRGKRQQKVTVEHAFMSMLATKPLLARSRQSAANQGEGSRRSCGTGAADEPGVAGHRACGDVRFRAAELAIKVAGGAATGESSGGESRLTYLSQEPGIGRHAFERRFFVDCRGAQRGSPRAAKPDVLC